MEMTLRCSGDWFRDQQQPSTGTSFWSALVVSVIVGSSGTGKMVPGYCWMQDHWANDGTPQYLAVDGNDSATSTPTEDLQRIREILSPGMSNLANIFGVSRQTVYNWLNGEQPRPEHRTRLRDLAQAADVLTQSGIPITGALLKRPVVGSKNLFEIAQAGGSALDVATLLVQIIQRETEQRKLLAARFAGRKAATRSVESDFPAENDNW